jgi:hypothetical protein
MVCVTRPKLACQERSKAVGSDSYINRRYIIAVPPGTVLLPDGITYRVIANPLKVPDPGHFSIRTLCHQFVYFG